MITLLKREVPTDDFTAMTQAELQHEWDKAKACFDQVLVQKTEADRTYVAAATSLNILDRLLRKLEQRAAADKRAAAKAQILYQRT